MYQYKCSERGEEVYFAIYPVWKRLPITNKPLSKLLSFMTANKRESKITKMFSQITISVQKWIQLTVQELEIRIWIESPMTEIIPVSFYNSVMAHFDIFVWINQNTIFASANHNSDQNLIFKSYLHWFSQTAGKWFKLQITIPERILIYDLSIIRFESLSLWQKLGRAYCRDAPKRIWSELPLWTCSFIGKFGRIVKERTETTLLGRGA